MYINLFISTSANLIQSNWKQLVLLQYCWFIVGFQKAEDCLWMWKTSDLRWLKAIQEGCLSLLGCKHQVHLAALGSPTDPAHSRAHPTLPTAQTISACPREAAGFHLQSHTTLPMGCIEPDPPGGWCTSGRCAWGQGLGLPQVSPCLPCPGCGGQALAGRSSETPCCPQTRSFPSLKTSWQESSHMVPQSSMKTCFLLPTKAWFYTCAWEQDVFRPSINRCHKRSSSRRAGCQKWGSSGVLKKRETFKKDCRDHVMTSSG